METPRRGEWYNEVDQNTHPTTTTKGDVSCLQCKAVSRNLQDLKRIKDVSLVTVGKRSYYVYRYQGKMNGHKDAAVLLSYPEKSFGEAMALRVFISTHTELTAQEILNIYAKRWNIEVFFRNCKQKLAFDKCQLRKKQGITRMWLILSFIHFLCCTVSGYVDSFDEGYNDFRNCVLQEIFAQNALSA